MNQHELELENALRAHSEERDRAFERIRSVAMAWSFPESIIHWALHFITLVLEDMSSTEWRQRQYEVDVLARFGPEADGLRASGEWTDSAIEDHPERTWFEDQVLRELPSRRTVRELQEITRSHLQDLFTPHGAQLVLPASTILSLHYSKNTNDKKNDQRVKEYTEVYAALILKAPLPIAFRYHLFEALRRNPEKLRHCVACRKPFFAIKRHREYCSDKCRARTNARISNHIPPERFGKKGRKPGTARLKTKTGKTTKQSTAKKGVPHGKRAR